MPSYSSRQVLIDYRPGESKRSKLPAQRVWQRLDRKSLSTRDELRKAFCLAAEVTGKEKLVKKDERKGGGGRLGGPTSSQGRRGKRGG